jgi:hypothetical protein
LISAVAAYYNARTGAAELSFKGAQQNAALSQESKVSNPKSEMATVEHWVKALLTEAQALAQMATSLFNNIHLQSSMAVNDSRTLQVQG